MMETEEFTPQDSKCWTCKHGMCLKEKDTQTFFQPAMVDGDAFEGEPEQPGMTEISFPITKVRSICFWRAAVHPVMLNCVTECNRYENN